MTPPPDRAAMPAPMAEPAPAQAPLTDELVRELLADTRAVFGASGPEARDVIEYVCSWLLVYLDKSRARAIERAHGIGATAGRGD